MKPVYAVVFEKTSSGYSAYVPDLPGCIAAGRTRPRVERLIAEAIALHVASLRSHGEPVPPPTTHVQYVALPAA